MWSASLHAIFRAFTCTVVPAAAALDEQSWGRFDKLVQATVNDRPLVTQRQLRVFLHLVQWTAVLRHGRMFTALAAPQRALLLTYLQDHPLRLVRLGFGGLRTLALLGYYGQPEVAHDLGYAPDARGWEAQS